MCVNEEGRGGGLTYMCFLRGKGSAGTAYDLFPEEGGANNLIINPWQQFPPPPGFFYREFRKFHVKTMTSWGNGRRKM